MKVFALVLSLAAAAAARMAYRFSDGYLDVLGAEPVQNFDCVGRSYGYYADVSTDCRVFHVCLPITDDAGELAETAHFSFFCANTTRFDQESLTCNHEDFAFPCQEAETLYELSNADFGRIPEGGFDVVLEGSSAPAPAIVRAAPRSEVIPRADDAELTADAEADAEAEADVEEAPVDVAPVVPVAIPASVPTLAAADDDAASEAETEADADAEANTEAAEASESQA